MNKDNPNLTFSDLKEAVGSYIKNKEELDLITKSYMYAYEKHFGQKRLTGEDYIIHPLNVAYILTGIRADYQTICAALLHDTIEDTTTTKEELADKFQPEIANLVDGVTKINRLNFQGNNEVVIANQRKILVGLSEDVRVIIIKLADRLHNLRNLWVLPEKKQKQKAKETLDILTPIAHRLGINSLKTELEDLSLRYYKPDVYFEIVEKLNQSKAERDNLLIEMKENISNLLNSHNIKHEIKGRVKSIYSIYNKLSKGRKFSDIYDLLALRVYVDSEQDCYQALGIIHSKYRPVPKRFKDYIAMPKTNMYQSLHTTVLGVDGQFYEIQIRTYDMDKVAEMGIASHWSYKENGSSVKASMQNAMEQKLQFFRDIMELKEENNDEDFVKQVKETIFKNTIYVFTPKGDVIEMPLGSTPIDFAYRVHSDVGDKMIGAIVNNNIVPLDYKLKSDDIVKINTNKNSFGPSREWIKIAHTTQAKNKIKSFYNKIDKDDYLKKGELLLKEELKKRKIVINDFYDQMENILSEFNYNNEDELYISLYNNKSIISQIISFYNKEDNSLESKLLSKITTAPVVMTNPKNDIVVSGIDNVKINIASCCQPVPGDRIIGYITKGNGISVHRMVCPNIHDLDDRLIEVKWNDNLIKKYATTLLVYTYRKKNPLQDIIAISANNDITIQKVVTNASSDQTLYEITVLVTDKEALLKFKDNVALLSDVSKVERLKR